MPDDIMRWLFAESYVEPLDSLGMSMEVNGAQRVEIRPLGEDQEELRWSL